MPYGSSGSAVGEAFPPSIPYFIIEVHVRHFLMTFIVRRGSKEAIMRFSPRTYSLTIALKILFERPHAYGCYWLLPLLNLLDGEAEELLIATFWEAVEPS